MSSNEQPPAARCNADCDIVHVNQVQVHVEADPDRVMAATVASSAQGMDSEGAFAPIHGYTTDALLKDKRFKV